MLVDICEASDTHRSGVPTPTPPSVPGTSRPPNQSIMGPCGSVHVHTVTTDNALASPIDNNRPLSEAGCSWTANDYSCAYDAVFMALFSIYRRSSLPWQKSWQAESAVNKFLVEQFNWIFEGFALDLDSFALSAHFSECRDKFCDWMFAVDSQKFPRHGRHLVGVSNILEYFSDQHNHSADLECIQLCSNPACPPTIVTRSFSFMCSPSVIRKFGDPYSAISVQSVVTQQLAFLLGRPLTSKCSRCSGDHIQSSWSVTTLTWIWFEIPEGTRISPSLTLAFDKLGEPRTFTLMAVVYLGGAHFTTRWRDRSGIWWKHDGLERRGSPVVDTINNESDLRWCDSRRMLSSL